MRYEMNMLTNTEWNGHADETGIKWTQREIDIPLNVVWNVHLCIRQKEKVAMKTVQNEVFWVQQSPFIGEH